jgi:hypothetical protein
MKRKGKEKRNLKKQKGNSANSEETKRKKKERRVDKRINNWFSNKQEEHESNKQVQ